MDADNSAKGHENMALNESDKDTYTKIVEKHAAKKEKQKETIAAKEEEGVKLVAERTETGLYTIRHRKAGRLPDSLKGMFSTKWKVEQAVLGYYGSLDPLN